MKSWRCWAWASARPAVTFDSFRECDTEVKQARSCFPGSLLGANASILDLGSLQPSQERQTLLLFTDIPSLPPPRAGTSLRQRSNRGAWTRPAKGRLNGMPRSVVAIPSPQSYGRDGKPPKYFLRLSGNRAGPVATARIFRAPSSDGEHRRHWTFLPARTQDPSFWSKCLNFPGESLSPQQLPGRDQGLDTQSHVTG